MAETPIRTAMPATTNTTQAGSVPDKTACWSFGLHAPAKHFIFISFPARGCQLIPFLGSDFRVRSMFAQFALGHRRTLPFALAVATLLAVLLAVAPAVAATRTWNGSQGNDHWTNTLNWTPAAVPNDGTADVIFAGTIRPTPDMNANWSVNSVTFNNTAAAFTLGSSTASTLTIGAGGITDNSVSQQVINHPVALTHPQTWSVTAGPLRDFGDVNNGGNTVTFNTQGNTIFLSGSISGSGGLIKTGSGQLNFDSGPANTYTGTTQVKGGTLFLFDQFTTVPGDLEIGDNLGAFSAGVTDYYPDEIADTSSVTVFASGSWALDNSDAVATLNITSTGIGGGTVILGGSATLTILGNLTMTSGSMSTTDSGTTLLKGALTTNAATLSAVISTRLDLGGLGHNFTIADGAALIDLDISGIVTSGAIIKNGPGSLRLRLNTYAGGTTLNAGTLLIGNDSALGTGPLAINGGMLQADGDTADDHQCRRERQLRD